MDVTTDIRTLDWRSVIFSRNKPLIEVLCIASFLLPEHENVTLFFGFADSMSMDDSVLAVCNLQAVTVYTCLILALFC